MASPSSSACVLSSPPSLCLLFFFPVSTPSPKVLVRESPFPAFFRDSREKTFVFRRIFSMPNVEAPDPLYSFPISHDSLPRIPDFFCRGRTLSPIVGSATSHYYCSALLARRFPPRFFPFREIRAWIRESFSTNPTLCLFLATT